MRFLRSAGDFLCRHVAQLPFAGDSHHVLNQMTALMKCAAIELKISGEKNQLSHFGNMCRLLLGLGSATTAPSYNESVQVELAHYQHTLIGLEATQVSQKKAKVSKMLCEILNCLEFEIKSVDRPKWDYFDNSLMNSLFASCEIVLPSSGIKLIDVKKIHAILREELNSVQSTIAAGQRQYIIQDIESIMTFALQVRNFI
jgi:nuclear pore complex protein Nup205